MILRKYPIKKNKLNYPVTYTFKIMINDAKLMSDFTKWLKGINYLTNRPLKSNSVTYKFLQKKFIIEGPGYSVLFIELKNINADDYLASAAVMRQEIDILNEEIIFYNKQVDIVINIIQTV